MTTRSLFHLPLIVSAFQTFLGLVSAAPQVLKNITIPVPIQSRSFPNTRTLCVPTSASDVVTFFLGNYVVHAASLKSVPGESTVETCISTIMALLCPTTGVMRALDAIFRHARTEKSALQQAARAGALCMVVRREDWKPHPGDIVKDARVSELPSHNQMRMTFHIAAFPSWSQGISSHWTFRDSRLHSLRKINGLLRLPEDGYDIKPVPRDAKICTVTSMAQQKPEVLVASSYSTLKSIAALAQAIYAAVTVYRVRGDQLNRYGMASFGLTVTPYVLMSIMNFFAHVVTPDYSALHLVRSDVMDEAERRGGIFDGVIGRLCLLDDADEQFQCIFERGGIDDGKRLSDPPGRALIKSNRHGMPSGKPVSPDSGAAAYVVYAQEVPLRREKKLIIPACSQFARAKSVQTSAKDLLPESRSWVVERLGPKRWNCDVGSRPLMVALSAAIGALPLIIIGVISRFQAAQSTKAERAWTMSWLAVSIVMGPWVQWYSRFAMDMWQPFHGERRTVFSKSILAAVMVVMWTIGCGLFLAPPTGGYIVVGQMLLDFGNCVRLY